MATFDALPKRVREVVAAASYQFDDEFVEMKVRELGEAGAVAWLKQRDEKLTRVAQGGVWPTR